MFQPRSSAPHPVLTPLSNAMATLPSLLAFALLGRQASAYTWPNPQMEMLDALRYEQTGSAGQGTGGFVFPCTQAGFIGGSDAGRINSADWLRTVSRRRLSTCDHNAYGLAGVSRHGHT
jgi:hypothetical protein